MSSNLGDTSFFVLFHVLLWFILVAILDFCVVTGDSFPLNPKVAMIVNFISCMIWIFNAVLGGLSHNLPAVVLFGAHVIYFMYLTDWLGFYYLLLEPCEHQHF